MNIQFIQDIIDSYDRHKQLSNAVPLLGVHDRSNYDGSNTTTYTGYLPGHDGPIAKGTGRTRKEAMDDYSDQVKRWADSPGSVAPYMRARYGIGGAALGGLGGYGIGHLIANKYKLDGWKGTLARLGLGALGAVGGALAGNAVSKREAKSRLTNPYRKDVKLKRDISTNNKKKKNVPEESIRWLG